jgi:uncharacterized OB-fold protein
MAEYRKPLPVPDMDSKEFWDGCHRHELLLQRCDNCHNYRYPPQVICPVCFSTDSKWEKANGRGEVYTFTVVRRALGPDWEDAVPYTIGVIQLDEGVRMVSNVVDCKPEDVRVGMKVAVTFDDVTENVALPKFKPTP